MRNIMRGFHYGEKGFTLIELLVVVAILGVLAAVAVPNVGKFMGTGKTQAAQTELHNIQTSVLAAMADGSVNVVGTPGTFSDTSDVTVSTNNTVGKFIVGYGTGGNGKVHGTYSVAADGTVAQTAYP